MSPESTALARALYEQSHRIAPRWAELSRAEQDAWEVRADALINKLDTLGYQLNFIPPEW